MKKTILTIAIVISSICLYAQPVPPSGAGHGSGSNQPAGGGAPIDGGFSILLVLGAIWAAKKVYEIRKQHSPQTEE